MELPSPGTRSLSRLADADFDLLVIGGGITGACVALEACRRGLATALVERGDFGGGATANCLRIVHGGLRYLQHMDVRRSRESTLERSMWLRSAPHLVEPLPVVVPTRRGAFPPRWLLAGALAVNEAISAGRNAGLEPGRRIPRARVLSRRECAALVPALDGADLTGGVLFHDAIMYSPERLTLEVLDAARAAGAVAANHVAFEGLGAARGETLVSRLRDTLTSAEAEVRSRWVVNASGAHVGQVAHLLAGAGTAGRRPQAPTFSLALNLVTGQPAAGPAFTVSGGAGDPDRVVKGAARQIFVVPWRGQRLVGTAHFPFRGDPAGAPLDEASIRKFLAEVRTASPSLDLSEDDVRHVQWGFLPVVGPGESDRPRLLKRHGIVDHANDGTPRALSVVSVKFTTARRVALDVVERIAVRDRAQPSPADMQLPGKLKMNVEAAIAAAQLRWESRLPADVIEHLVRSYGARHERVIELAGRLEGGDRRIVADAPVVFAQLVYGALEEQARTADDLLWRRTELGPRGLITESARRDAERALALATDPT